jgi:hypothetical protein
MTSLCTSFVEPKLWCSNSQSIDGLYCVGDSCFPGQGVIAVAFSGIMCAHRVAADIGKFILLVYINSCFCFADLHFYQELNKDLLS